MIIQNIGTRALSMYIDGRELNEMGLDPDDIGVSQANELLKKALNNTSLKQWKAAEMEVYPGKDSILLFVRRKSTKPYYFIFKSFELLIQACEHCPPLHSSLTAVGDKYLLTVYPAEGDNPPAVLLEYGTESELSPYLATHYEEQGKTVFAKKAIFMIKMYFSKQN